MSVREIVVGETALAHRAMRTLRPQYDEAAFVRRIDDLQRREGYRLVGSFEEGVEHAVAVAGFRLGHGLAWGHFLYVDDLSTLPEVRRRGHGRLLLDWLDDEGRRLGCDQLHLDSGTAPDRADAHRLYFNARLRIASYHFAREL